MVSQVSDTLTEWQSPGGTEASRWVRFLLSSEAQANQTGIGGEQGTSHKWHSQSISCHPEGTSIIHTRERVVR